MKLDGVVIQHVAAPSSTARRYKRWWKRLKEIDAPELKQPFGKRSRQSLADLCASKRARVLWTEKDRNGRLLACVWCSGIDANAD